jgi:hypothetical protein
MVHGRVRKPVAYHCAMGLAHTTAAGCVSSITRSLQSPVIAAQRLANVDFGERITTKRTLKRMV